MTANYALLIAMSLAWAANNVFISWVDHDLPPITSSTAITGVAALYLALFVRFAMRRPLLPALRANPAALVLMGLTAVGLPQLSAVTAEDTISPGLASVVGTTVPILTLLASTFILRTTPSRIVHHLGVVLAAVGVIVFAGPAEIFGGKAEWHGIAIMMAGGVVFVFNGLYAAARTEGLDRYALTVWVMAFACASLAVAALVFEGVPRTLPNRHEVLSILASGLVGMGGAYLLYYLLIDRAGAPFTSLYAFLVPPLGVLCSFVLDGEALTWQHAAGVAIVLVGLWLVLKPVPGAA